MKPIRKLLFYCLVKIFSAVNLINKRINEKSFKLQLRVDRGKTKLLPEAVFRLKLKSLDQKTLVMTHYVNFIKTKLNLFEI